MAPSPSSIEYRVWVEAEQLGRARAGGVGDWRGRQIEDGGFRRAAGDGCGEKTIADFVFFFFWRVNKLWQMGHVDLILMLVSSLFAE
jgi:hypothetical protein